MERKDAKLETYLEFETLYDETARVWVCVQIDDTVYRWVHLCGPKKEVRAYFDGKLKLTEIDSIWNRPLFKRTT